MRCASVITAWVQYAIEFTIWTRDRLARHFSNASIDAPQHGFQRDAGILPGFDQRPIERRKQEQAGAARALKMLLYFGEIIEVIEQVRRPMRHRVRSQMSRRPSRSGFRPRAG